MTVADRYQFFLDFPGVGNVEAYPVNSVLEWTWKRQQGHRFFRRELTTKLIFINDTKEGIKDFNSFYELERRRERCEKIMLTITSDCGTTTGYCTVMDCNFDVDGCKVTVKFIPQDDYTCITDNWRRKINILERIEKINITAYVGELEISATCCQDIQGDIEDFKDFEDAFATGCLDQPLEGWVAYTVENTWSSSNIPQDPRDGGWEVCTTWIREVVSEGAVPDGSGWIAVTGGGWARPIPTRLVTDTVGVGSVRKNYVPAFPEIGIDNGMYLNQIIELFLNEYCSLPIVSNFLGIAPDGTQPNNQVYTEAQDKYQEIVVFDKTDIIRVNADENATLLDVTLEQLLIHLAVVFNVWLEVIDGKIYLEHLSYFERTKGIDLTTANNFECIGGKWIYAYAKEELPNSEKWIWMDQTDVDGDFDGLPIEYDNACVNSNVQLNEIFFNADFLTTNLEYILQTAEDENSSIIEDGMVWVATKDKVIVSDVGKISLDNRINGPMAWANLMDYFHQYERPFKVGVLNKTETSFVTTKKVRKQVPINIKFCCSDISNFQPSITTVITQMGYGEIDSAVYSDPPELLILNLKYD